MQKTGDVVYQCANGEVVTFTFVNHNTDMRITYRFEDEQMGRAMQGNSFNFTMAGTMRILRVFFHFINQDGVGGFYDVSLSGSLGGDFPDPPPERQAGDFVPFRRYVFVP
jgi:hypothetical protein